MKDVVRPEVAPTPVPSPVPAPEPPPARPALWRRIVGVLLPRGPDFHALINEQCDQAVATMDELARFMRESGKKAGRQVISAEREGDTLKRRNLDILARAFTTPFDREDVYRAIVAIDQIMNYAKSTVLEMTLLGVAPDIHTMAMASCLRDGADALRQGFAKLATNPAGAEADAERARKAERQMEKIYRAALAELFDLGDMARQIRDNKKVSQRTARIELEVAALERVMRTFKKREIYRHLSNAGDRLADAAATLHDIVVRTS